MSYLDEYNELKKKRKQEEYVAPTYSSPQEKGYMEEYNAIKTQRLTSKQGETFGSVLDRLGYSTPGFRSVVESYKPKEEEERRWFEKGAFEDGYQFGDITKTILGTGTEVLYEAEKGIVSAVEKVDEFGASIAPYGFAALRKIGSDKTYGELLEEEKAKAAEYIAKDLIDEEAIARKLISVIPSATRMITTGSFNPLEMANMIRQQPKIEEYIETKMEENSVLGEKSEALVQSAGQLALQYGLQMVGVPWFLTAGVTSFGGEMENALKQGATYDQAMGSATITAGAEILSEKLFGGDVFTHKAGADLASKWLATNISNKAWRTFLKFAGDAATEGVEEVFSQFVSNLGSKLYREENLGEILFSEEALDGYLEAAIGGFVLGGGMSGINAVQSSKKGVDYTTGLTENEQTVVEQLYNERVAEESKNGDVSQKRKNAIYDEIVESMEKGDISTDDIERILGGDAYNAYTELQKESDEFNNLYETSGEKLSQKQKDRLAELNAKNTSTPYSSELLTSKQNLSDTVFGLVKNDRLVESYNERGKRGQAFQADLTQYDEAQRATVQKAIDSGILNDTRRSHELVDLIAKISADKGIAFDFTNNEKLKESGFAIDGKAVNGYVTKDGVTLNVNSSKYLNTVVGHEITHVLEGTEFYDTLQQTLFEYAKSKGDYQSRYDAIAKLYSNVEGANIEAELTADLVGDYLFTDSDFIKNLSIQHRNVFQKLYDEIKYLLKVATAGSKEAKQLERVKKAFADAYKAGNKSTADTKYSISSETDQAYIDAVNRGDMATAQRMVEKSADKAMPNSLIRDQNGNLIPVYHGSANRFTAFDHNKMNAHGNAHGRGFYFTDNKSFAEGYAQDGGQLLGGYLNIEKPLSEEKVTIKKSDLVKLIKATCEEQARSMKVDEGYASIKEALPDTWISNYVYTYGMNLNDAYREVANIIYSGADSDVDIVAEMTNAGAGNENTLRLTRDLLGYDGVIYTNTDGTHEYVSLVSSQFKSADPVTYDDNGNVIPLSERFNVENPDIRFSLSDSDGRPLSEGQQQYFADSKVRDENGNLKVMYHGTPNGDFTIFKDGTYFTDNKAYADRYQSPSASSISSGKTASNPKTYEVYLDIKKPFDINDAEARNIYINEYIKGGNAIGINPYLSDAEYDKITTIDWTEGEDLRDFLIENDYDYDGLVLDEGADGGYGEDVQYRGKSYVIFNSEQVKSVDNLNPTEDPDIRRSLSEDGEQPKRYGNYNISGEEVALDESIAPMQETVAENTEAEVVADDVAPANESIYNKRDGENGWGNVYGTAQEALNDAVKQVNPDLWAAIEEEGNNATGRAIETPMLYALHAVREDVRQDAITPIQGAQLLNEAYTQGGVDALKRLYNPRTGNLYAKAREQAKRRSSGVASVDTPANTKSKTDVTGGLEEFARNHGKKELWSWWSKSGEKKIADALLAEYEASYDNDSSVHRLIDVIYEIAPNLNHNANGETLSDKAVVRQIVTSLIDDYRKGNREWAVSDFAKFADVVKNIVTINNKHGEVTSPRLATRILRETLDHRNVDYYSKWYNKNVKNAVSEEAKADAKQISKMLKQYGKTFVAPSESVVTTQAEAEYAPNAVVESEPVQSNALVDDVAPMPETAPAEASAKTEAIEPAVEESSLMAETDEPINESFDALMAEADRYAPPARGARNYIAPDASNATSVNEGATANGTAQTATQGETQPETPRTRKELQASIVDNAKTTFAENGLDLDEVLKNAKNLSTFATVDNTPQRVMEKALGYKAGQILSDITVNKVAQDESKGITWLNSYTDRKDGTLAQISKKYGIKPGSKESAAAQMYAEGFYVAENNDIIAYGDAELAADFPNYRVQNNIKRLARDPQIRQIYDETLARINESRRRNGYPEIQRLDNYFLHFRAMEDTFSRLGLPFNPNDIKAKDLPTDLNGVTADLKPGQPYFASAMHRTGKRTSFDLLGGLERYLSSAKNQIYHIDNIQTLRALRNYIADTYGQANGLEGLDVLSEEEAQERIEKVYGSHLSTFAKFLNEEANVLAGKTALIDRGLEGIIGRRGITFLNTVNGQVGSNMVGFNGSSALTNLLSVAQTFAKTNKFDFVKAFSQTVSNKIGSLFGRGDGFTENSPLAIRRKGAERFYRTPYQKVQDAGYVFMSAVDNVATELIARTKYNEFTRKGMDSQTAHFETDKWASKLMGDRSLGQQPQLYNSKMLGLVTKFQLEVRNQLDSQFYDTVQETKASNEDIENALARNAKTAAKVASTFFQLAVAQHVFGMAFKAVAGYNPAFDIIEVISKLFGFDDEEDSEDTVLDNIEQGFFALLEDLPYTSLIMDGGRIPISSALPIKQLVNGKDNYGNEKSRLQTALETAPYYLLPGGYGQIKKTYNGLKMFDDDHPIAGSYTDSGDLRFPVEDTIGSRVQAGIFGQWANKNARDYFDNNRSPLNERQVQEYIDLDLPISEYWQLQETYKEVEKAAKAEGATDEQILSAKYIDSVGSELSALQSVKDSLELGLVPEGDEYKSLRVRYGDHLPDHVRDEMLADVEQQMNDLANERASSYADVKITGDYANVGGRYYKKNEDGEWSKMTDDQVTKYLTVTSAGNAHYATNGSVHYRLEDGGDWRNMSDWTKISDKQLERQNEVTEKLGITPNEYWANTDISFIPMAKGEYEYAYDNPENYTVAKAVGGYDAYKTYTGDMYDIKADKDANGKSISGSRKEKIIEYVNGLDIDYGMKLILFKSEYNSDDTYNEEIIEYLNSRNDITFTDMKTILKELGFEVDEYGNITW